MNRLLTPIQVLQQYWGFPAFRPLQEDIINAVLEERDTLALLPTGGGKSLCFQVPALCCEGICLVISPLIALMKDQVYNLKRRGIPAAAIYSGMHHREIDILFENACNGAYKFLYLSPERLKTELARERIKRMQVSLIAVDEAHCISQWGYDFRPSYLEIADLRLLTPTSPILALTATATPQVVEDIVKKLAFRIPSVFQQSFSRTNLSYSVLYEENKRAKLLDILRNVPGSGIVYVRSRGETKEIAHFLTTHKISADSYHAGLKAEERSAKQDAWIAGKSRIMVCTNAFGMGIDKPDVRTVVHINLPDSLEAYFQEAGRAGRDGLKSYATLLYTAGDADKLRRQVAAAFPSMDLVRRVYAALGSYTQLATGAGTGESFNFNLQQFCDTYKLEQSSAFAALRLLEQDGWISLSDDAYTPARVQAIGSREVLYDYQLRNRTADLVFQVLLRAYSGIQLQPVEISEPTVAKYANLPVEVVRQTLEAAQRENILAYFPQQNSPQLVFTRERAPVELLQIDQKRFNFRKKQAGMRVEAAIEYAEKRQCRSIQLLGYFGEKDGKACGICDVCTGRNRADFSEEAYRVYERKIRELLRPEALPLEEILKGFAQKRHALVAQTLQFLLDEGKIAQSEDGKLRFVS